MSLFTRAGASRGSSLVHRLFWLTFQVVWIPCHFSQWCLYFLSHSLAQSNHIYVTYWSERETAVLFQREKILTPPFFCLALQLQKVHLLWTSRLCDWSNLRGQLSMHPPLWNDFISHLLSEWNSRPLCSVGQKAKVMNKNQIAFFAFKRTAGVQGPWKRSQRNTVEKLYIDI